MTSETNLKSHFKSMRGAVNPMAEALRHLRRLATPDCFAHRLLGGEFAVVQRTTRLNVAVLDAKWIAVFLSCRWIAPIQRNGGEKPDRMSSHCFEISSCGRAALAHADCADNPHAAQHRVMETKIVGVADGKPVYATVNAAESPLSWLRSKRGAGPHISDEEFEAGERLRNDFTLAQMAPRVTVNWSNPINGGNGGNGPENISAAATHSRDRVMRALTAVGPGLSGLLLSVCCFLDRLEPAEQEHGLPRRSGKVILKLALSRLAAHYAGS
jgi:hypothetical protein